MIKVYDLAFVTYGVRDLGQTEKFLTDFGMHLAERTDDKLYMRAVDSDPYVFVAERTEKTGLISLALELSSEEGLDEATTLPGAGPVEDIGAPGGGRRVSLAGSAGYRFELVHGIEPTSPLKTRAPHAVNFASRLERRNAPVRIPEGPSDIQRISHVAIAVRDVGAAAAWFTGTLGFIVTDYVEEPGGNALVAAFMRTDKGSELCDHHVVAVVREDTERIHHCSFWTEDFDALHGGDDWMRAQGHRHVHGIGRHGAGSQVYSYWRHPDGFLVERFTDGDVFDNTVAPNRIPADTPNLLFQWGPEAKPTFFEIP